MIMATTGMITPAASMDVLTGTQDLIAGLGDRIPVAKVVVHPAYDYKLIVNDVAVLVLSRATAAPPLRPARLADVESGAYAGLYCYAFRRARKPVRTMMQCA